MVRKNGNPGLAFRISEHLRCMSKPAVQDGRKRDTASSGGLGSRRFVSYLRRVGRRQQRPIQPKGSRLLWRYLRPAVVTSCKQRWTMADFTYRASDSELHDDAHQTSSGKFRSFSKAFWTTLQFNKRTIRDMRAVNVFRVGCLSYVCPFAFCTQPCSGKRCSTQVS